MKWKLKELEDAVRKAHGDKYADAIQDPSQSFVWKSEMAHYHACEAESLIKQAFAVIPEIDEDDSPSIAASKAVLTAAATGDDGLNMRVAKFKAEAHIIASAQALHSLCDIVCQIVYWAYRLDTVACVPKPNKLNLHSLCVALESLPHYATTCARINQVIDSPEFIYLRAYVNTTKHKSLVASTLSAVFTEDRGGIRFQAFTYTDPRGNTTSFDRKWATDFVLPENNLVREKLMAVGSSLNDYFA